jgi:hypothetical protein
MNFVNEIMTNSHFSRLLENENFTERKFLMNTRDLVNQEFEKWKKNPPNAVQRGMGFVFKPVEFLIKPFCNAAAPLLEGVLKGANNFISDTLQKWSGEMIDIVALSEDEFITWLKHADINAKNWITGGISALTAEGAGTGLGGLALIAVDIPASFGLILGFANKITLTYQLDITDEEVQILILKAISAGSETSVNGKLSSASTIKAVSNIITKQTWKSMEQAPLKSLPNLIATIRALLKRLGINITKRKAGQLIPAIGAITGGVINGSWAAVALEAVRQCARVSIVECYYSKKVKNETANKRKEDEMNSTMDETPEFV